MLRSCFFRKYNPRSIVPRRYLRILFKPLQCLLVGAELNLANRLTANAISGLVPFAKKYELKLSEVCSLSNQVDSCPTKWDFVWTGPSVFLESVISKEYIALNIEHLAFAVAMPCVQKAVNWPLSCKKNEFVFC